MGLVLRTARLANTSDGWLSFATYHPFHCDLDSFCVTRCRRWVKVSRGFTLVELLVAMAISAVIAAVLYTFLASVLKTQDQSDLFSKDLSRLQKTLVIIQRDVEQAVNRSARDAFGDSHSALRLTNGVTLELIRTGWTLPPFVETKRSTLQRVRYQLREGDLIRTHWRTPDITDTATPQSPIETVLLSDIEALEFKVVGRDENSTVSDRWPMDSSIEYDELGRPIVELEPLPRLLQVRFEHPRFGQLEKVFRMVGLPEAPQYREEEANTDSDEEESLTEPDSESEEGDEI